MAAIPTNRMTERAEQVLRVAANPDTILWESWGTEHAVFCVPTGETHLLSELPAEVLRRLSQSPQTLDGLSEALARDCEVDNSAPWNRKIAAIVKDLRALELVDAVQ